MSTTASVHDELIKTKHVSRKVYQELCKIDNEADRDVMLRWENDLDIQITLDDFQKAFRNVYTVTNITKYRDFQFRLLHRSRAIVLNSHLYRWGIINTNICSFCGVEKETLKHLFVDCEEIQQLWRNVENLCVELNGARGNFTARNIMFNTVNKSPRNVCNFVCAVTKQYIYAQRCAEKTVNYIELKVRILQLRNVELYNAKKSGNLKKHESKWNYNAPLT